MLITDLIAQARQREAVRQRLAEETEHAQERERQRCAKDNFRSYIQLMFGPACISELGVEIVWADEPGHVGPAGRIRVRTHVLYLILKEEWWYLGTPESPMEWPVDESNYRGEPERIAVRYDKLLIKLGDLVQQLDY